MTKSNSKNKQAKNLDQGFFKFFATKQHLKALKNYIDLKKF